MDEEASFSHFSDDLFHEVFSLSQRKQMSWEELSHKIPQLPRGWYELAHLPLEDRIEFSRAFWFSKLLFTGPFAHLEERLDAFFDDLEEIEIYATQLDVDQPFDIHMIYTLKDDLGFFQGAPPAPTSRIAHLQSQLSHVTLPSDYLAFLEIHDGFSKYTDTGMISSRDMPRIYRRFQESLQEEELLRPDGQLVIPESLIPFYESFGLHCFQCFYADWYGEGEMGNVFFSLHERAMSNFLDPHRLSQNLAFPTFLDWLVFYLEDIWQLP